MSKRLHPEAVLFDMDGVIVDSMPYHFLAWYEALRAFDAAVTSFDVYEHEGEPWQTTLPKFLDKNHKTYDERLVKKIFAYRQKIFKRIFKRYIFHGADHVLTTLHKRGMKLALVSGTPHRDIRKILPKHLYKLFDVVVGGDQVKHGKPHPEPYRTAAKHLGVKPQNCVVVENAPLGIRSAKAAKMTCIAITTSLPKPYLKKADIVVERISDLEGLLL